MINKYPSEIETPLDRRAMTIDIMAGEIERKNKSIKYWREKAEYHRNKAVEFQNANEVLLEENGEISSACARMEENCEGKIQQIEALKEEIEKYKLAKKYDELPEVKNFYAGRLASHSNVKTTERYAKILDKAESNKRKKKKINGKATETKF